MKLFVLIVVTLCFVVRDPGGTTAAEKNQIPVYVSKLLKSYPDQIIGFKNNQLIWKDSSTTLYDDRIKKDPLALLDNPDIEDQMRYKYLPGVLINPPPVFNDPGRIRNEIFFKKMYGETKEAVEKSLVEVIWCPKLVGQKLLVTKINHVDKKIDSISRAIDSFPELKKYVTNIAGTFNWRKISGTNRISAHSYGMTIDINVEQSHYWQWDCNCIDEKVVLTRKNNIPQKLVDIFERYGFIWGGKWYHYDTMHFEYRPDLL